MHTSVSYGRKEDGETHDIPCGIKGPHGAKVRLCKPSLVDEPERAPTVPACE